jgi:hypothetical protein
MTERRLPWIAFGCFAIGLLLLLLVDAGAARAVAVPLIFVGIYLGVRAIASPEFLERDRNL